MGFNSVYQCLMDVFPQVDSRLLRAVAIENSKNADTAVEIVLSEVLPYLSKIAVSPSCSNQKSQNGVSIPFMPKDKSAIVNVTSASNDKNQTSTLTSSQKNKLPISASSSTSEEHSPIELSDGEDNEEVKSLVNRRRVLVRHGPHSFGAAKAINGGVNMKMRKLVRPTKQAETNKEAQPATADADLRSSDLTSGSSLVDKSAEKSAITENEEVILLGKSTKELINAVESSQIDDKWLDDMLVNGENADDSANIDQEQDSHNNAVESSQIDDKWLDGILANGENADDSANIDQERDSHIRQENSLIHENDDVSSCGENDLCDTLKDIDGPRAVDIDLNISAETENTVEEHSRNESITSLEGDEYEPKLNNIITRSGQICNVDLLEEIIEDARLNKKTLFLAMESILVMMKEIELEEKSAEQAKEDAANAGLDIMKKVEELKEMLSHAKEANDMHAGEVYGEKSILSTEVRELQTRVLSLAEERDKSLAILEEMRQTLEARRAEAEEIRKAAEKEKLEKTESAQSLLAEQEAAMENVVQESKILQQEAEENSKLRDFLIERGRVVDTLQGEISVICHDVRLLKENFDNRVPLSKSISSSQTSCRLASSSSSLKSVTSDLEKSLSTKDGSLASSNLSLKSISSDLEKSLSPMEVSPTQSVCGQSSKKSSDSPKNKYEDERIRADDHKELLDDGWDLFETENGMYSPFT